MNTRCLKLFTTMLSLSAFTFGGGFVIIPLMQRRFVRDLGWLTEEEILDMVAFARASPGAVTVNVAVQVGTRIAGVPVYHADDLERFVAGRGVDVGMLTVPIAAAQEMGDRLAQAGVKGIWNFTNYEITCARKDVVVESVHFSDSLLALSYMISQRERPGIQEENP